MLTDIHCVKGVRIRRYSGSYFTAFGLNTERYGISLRISVQLRENASQNNSKYGDYIDSHEVKSMKYGDSRTYFCESITESLENYAFLREV